MTRLSLALTGDTIMQRHVSTCDDPGFLGAVDVVRTATAGFTNLEGMIQAGEDWHAFMAGNGRLATFVRSPTYIGEELRWMGFRLLSLTNNHAADFAEGGVLTELKYLKQWPDLVGAGIGTTLTDASMPKYLDTPAGVVALIAAADWGPRGLGDLAFPPPLGALAADHDRYYGGRPGLNLLRYDCEFTVPAEQLEHLRAISAGLNWEQAKNMRRGGGGRAEPMVSPSPDFDEDESDGSLYFMGRKFVAGDDYTFRTIAYTEDVARVVHAVEEARRQADWVVVSQHQQGAGRSREEPPDHSVQLARASVAAGADVFIAHGAGRVGGVEFIGDRGVAVYGPGSFIIHLDQVKQFPLEMMRRVGLGYEDESGQLLEIRTSNENKVGAEVGLHNRPDEGGLNAVVMVELEKGHAPTVMAHPLELASAKDGKHMIGMPRLLTPDGERGSTALAMVDRRSTAFGSMVKPDGTVVPSGRAS